MRVPPRSRLRSGTHDRHAERHHRVAASGALAGRYGELDVLAQQAVGADQLQQVALGGRMLGIEPVLAVIRPQAREGDRILRAPVPVLQIADVQRREERLGAPVLQPDQVAHADLVDAGLAQAVGRLEPVAVVGLAAAQVIDRIALAVVRFLIDVDRVQP